MDKLLTIDDLARILNVKKSTIYQWVHMRLIPYIKVGRFVRFREKDIQRWLKSREVQPARKFTPIL